MEYRRHSVGDIESTHYGKYRKSVSAWPNPDRSVVYTRPRGRLSGLLQASGAYPTSDRTCLSSNKMSASPKENPSSKQPRPLACVLCQRRKVKCDRNYPCANCVKVRKRITRLSMRLSVPSPHLLCLLSSRRALMSIPTIYVSFHVSNLCQRYS